jgi:hypothetical protein
MIARLVADQIATDLCVTPNARTIGRARAASVKGRARSIRFRSRGECIACQRSLRRCTLSQKSGLLPNTRARMSAVAAAHIATIVAQLIDVLALHAAHALLDQGVVAFTVLMCLTRLPKWLSEQAGIARHDETSIRAGDVPATTG